MKPRMILLTATATAALAGAAAQIAGAVATGAPSSGSLNAPRIAQSSWTAPNRQHTGAQSSLRAKRLLHNPGLPAWIP